MSSRPHLHLSPTPRFQLRTAVIFAAGAVILVALITLMLYKPKVHAPSANSTEFFFTPTADNLYENPANWRPAYPGAHIEPDQTVTIQGVAYIPHYDLEVAGTLVIMLDATLYAANQAVVVLPGGALINDGELMAQRVENAGRVTNNLTATLDLHEYLARPGAETENLRGAQFSTSLLLTNEGTFHNYGSCRVKDAFDNRGTFHQSPGSELILQDQVAKTLPASFLP